MSKAGKIVLLKTIAQAVRNYIASLFLLQRKTCDEIKKIMNAYLWSNSREGGGMKWRTWGQSCGKKGVGGLVFRKVHDFNVALLDRILTQPQ